MISHLAYFRQLQGTILSDITKAKNDSELIFTTINGAKYKMYSMEGTCSIDDINGDLSDLIGTPILLAEQVSDEDFEKSFEDKFTNKFFRGKEYLADEQDEPKPESYTWTFYKLATIKGYVDIRWFGESNGWYSESVNFIVSDKDGNFPKF